MFVYISSLDTETEKKTELMPYLVHAIYRYICFLVIYVCTYSYYINM